MEGVDAKSLERAWDRKRISEEPRRERGVSAPFHNAPRFE